MQRIHEHKGGKHGAPGPKPRVASPSRRTCSGQQEQAHAAPHLAELPVEIVSIQPKRLCQEPWYWGPYRERCQTPPQQGQPAVAGPF